MFEVSKNLDNLAWVLRGEAVDEGLADFLAEEVIKRLRSRVSFYVSVVN